MRSRDIVLFSGAGLLLAGAAVFLWNGPADAGPLPPPPAAPAAPAPAPEAQALEGGPATAAAERVAADGSDPGSGSASAAERAGLTHGIVRGDIPITASCAGRIQGISVWIDELKSAHAGGERPWQKVVPVELGIGTPTFEIRGIPFSDYGYTVRARAPGFNGGERTLAITAETPVHDDLKLPITPGAPFSVLLRDQDLGPVTFTDVRLIPVGQPLGRPPLEGRSDNFGSALFQSVLAGDYQVVVGPPGQPLVQPPAVIQVQPGVPMLVGDSVMPQGTTVTVPRGVSLKVKVTNAGGWPLAAVSVRAQAADRKQLLFLEGETDVRGEIVFPHLLDGLWQVDARLDGHEPRTRQVRIAGGEEPAPVALQMMRAR